MRLLIVIVLFSAVNLFSQIVSDTALAIKAVNPSHIALVGTSVGMFGLSGRLQGKPVVLQALFVPEGYRPGTIAGLQSTPFVAGVGYCMALPNSNSLVFLPGVIADERAVKLTGGLTWYNYSIIPGGVVGLGVDRFAFITFTLGAAM
jgi:hypothetical protein